MRKAGDSVTYRKAKANSASPAKWNQLASCVRHGVGGANKSVTGKHESRENDTDFIDATDSFRLTCKAGVSLPEGSKTLVCIWLYVSSCRRVRSRKTEKTYRAQPLAAASAPRDLHCFIHINSRIPPWSELKLYGGIGALKLWAELLVMEEKS